MTPERTPTLAQVFQRARDRLAEEIHTTIPAEVVRYDAEKRLADVQPLIKNRYRNEQGAEVVEALPVVTNCPVVFVGGGNFRFLFDLVKGDTVLVAFAEASIDKWTSQGGNVDPIDPRRLALSDGIVVGSLRPASRPFKGDASEGPSIAHDETLCGIHFRETEVLLGTPSAAEFVALASLVDDAIGYVVGELNALKTSHNGHVHTSAMGPTGPPVVPLTPSVDASPTAAAKVRAE